jgi:peroxiredoxin
MSRAYRSRRRAIFRTSTIALVCGAILAICSCGPSTQGAAVLARSAAPPGPALEFDLEAIDGKRVSLQTIRDRNTVVGFITTYDLASQALANFLKTVAREHVPRINVIAIVLERPDDLPLVRAFVDTLGLRFPVVSLDPKDQPGTAFKDMTSVPSVLILDANGRPVWRKNGIVEAKEMDQVLRTLE